MIKNFILGILATLLLLGGFSVTVVGNHHHMPGCPFMPGEQAMCDMTPISHMEAWQQIFSATIPLLYLYVLLAGIVVYELWKRYKLVDIFVRRLVQIYDPGHDYTLLYTQLFSTGILNPKAP